MINFEYRWIVKGEWLMGLIIPDVGGARACGLMNNFQLVVFEEFKFKAI